MKLEDLLKAAQDSLDAARKEREALAASQKAMLDKAQAEGRSALSADEDVEFSKLSERKAEFDNKTLSERQGKVASIEAEIKADAEYVRTSQERTPGVEKPAYDKVARIGQEKRTYTKESDPSGAQFVRDIGKNFLYGDVEARERIARHMSEERVERGAQIQERAAGTGAFSGLTVPQYLIDMVAPKAQAGRPFANAINHHDLPPDGMTVNISRITTSTATGLQSAENAAVTEQNIDDTLLTINVQTNAGQQTLSRQAIERSSGAENIMLQDLVKSYNTTLDNTLITQATNGLSAVSTSIAYTDASPTAAELYPKLLDGAQRIETALMGQATADLAVMHPRRWGWLQSQVGPNWPFIGQPGIPTQAGGVNYANEYGSGFRGLLPSGLAVVTDANVGTLLGAGTEDEVYVVASEECHLWEDPNAPVYIRAEQPAAASLGVLFVVYGYFAYTFARYTSATFKIAGTGLIAPTF